MHKERRGGKLSEIIAFGISYGVSYVAYKGGQHIQPEKQAELSYSPALDVAQYHPLMAELYTELLRIHRDLGCQLFAHFSSFGRQGTRWGSWGAKASQAEPDAPSPKMRALLECNAVRT